MKKKFILATIVFIIFIILYTLPLLFIAVPKTIELAKLENSREFSIILPHGEGFEPWIAVKNCVPFEIYVQIFNNDEEIYNDTLNDSSNQLDRLGDLSNKYKNKNFCKFPIVQEDYKKWNLFQYGKKYIIKVDVKKIPPKANIYLNLDYLSIWFPRNKK